MSLGRSGLIASFALSFLETSVARAQGTPPTCSFDADTATVTVTVNGKTARVQAIAASDEIRLNGVACGGATVNNTDSIAVNGGALADEVTLTGGFEPGLTAESDGTSEIEIAFALGAGSDTLTVNLSPFSDRVTFTGSGMDMGRDLDEDIVTAGTEFLEVVGKEGNDFINASDYTGTPVGGRLDLYGGDGNDRLTGDRRSNSLFGGAGDDQLYGKEYHDDLYGGSGNDSMYGGPGNDAFIADSVPDGSDYMNGGQGANTVNYDPRAVSVTVTLGDGLANDGEAGEGDFVESDVSRARGGSGDDVLIAASTSSVLLGGGGNDELFGGPGADAMYGGNGADSLIGGAGNDFVFGEAGDDAIDGGPGHDSFGGGDGNDTIFNADASAENVDCGAGTDDAEPDPLDTLIGCEL